MKTPIAIRAIGSTKSTTNLHLRVRPPRHLDNHIQYRLLLICKQRDVVKRRDGDSILLNIHSVLERVGGVDLPRRVDRRGLAVVALFGDGEGGHCG